MIFTIMWAFDMQSNWDYVAHISDIFKQQNADIYYTELISPQEIRLQRNTTENRLKHKPSKRDTEISNQRLLGDDKNHRCVSNDGEITFENYIKIDNADLSPEIVAKMIKKGFLYNKILQIFCLVSISLAIQEDNHVKIPSANIAEGIYNYYTYFDITHCLSIFSFVLSDTCFAKFLKLLPKLFTLFIAFAEPAATSDIASLALSPKVIFSFSSSK